MRISLEERGGDALRDEWRFIRFPRGRENESTDLAPRRRRL